MPARSVRELAEEAHGCFVSSERADGSVFVKLRDGSPEWVQGLVQAAHGLPEGGLLPDDYRYRWAADVCEEVAHLAEDVEPEDVLDEWADAGVDVYNADLLAWLGSHESRVGYADEGLLLVAESRLANGVMAAIRAGQAMERREVFSFMVDALRERELALASAEAS